MQRRIKRGRFLSSLSNEKIEIEDESDKSNYTPSRFHRTSSAQSIFFHLINLDGDTNDEMKFIGGQSRIVVIYKQQR